MTLAATDDSALVGALRAGDEDAFMHLVDAYGGPMRRFALSIVRNAAAADDVVQDAWVGVLRGLDRFEGRSSLKTWIFRIVVEHRRRRAPSARRARVPFSALASEGDDEPAVDAGPLPQRRRVLPRRLARASRATGTAAAAAALRTRDAACRRRPRSPRCRPAQRP